MTQMSSEERVNGLSIRWHKAVVRSGLVHHFVCADFFPVSEKKDVLSNPFRARNAGRAYALAGGMTLQISWIEIYLNLLPIPNDTHNFYAPIDEKNEIAKTVISVSLAMCFVIPPVGIQPPKPPFAAVLVTVINPYAYLYCVCMHA